jgi:hypothetical protein
VIAGYIKAVKLIVQGKGEVAYITPFKGVVLKVALEVPRFRGGGEEGEVLNDGVVHNAGFIVKVKGHLKGVGIGYEAEDEEEENIN